jgi:polyhydroxybutyrate depolymerase
MRTIWLAALVAGCGIDFADECPGKTIDPDGHEVCTVPGWLDRAFELDVPATWDRSAPLPVIVLIHGGGGNRKGINRSTCPDGDVTSPGCLVAMAKARGYAVVAPDGTGSRPLEALKTWNAGGGHTLQCTSGGACKSNVDDLAFFDDLFGQLERTIPIDPRRVYATGISNGGAMSHRLGCQMAARFAAIIGVASGNEWADDGGACDVQTPVLEIHGTEDPCWLFDGGVTACLQEDGESKTSVPTTMDNWRVRNGCAATFVDTARPDRDPDDGTTLSIRTWDACAATTELFIVTGGGHTWPGGWRYFSEDRVGRASREDDNTDVLDFFDAHVHP